MTFICGICNEILRTNEMKLYPYTCKFCESFLNIFYKECRKHPQYSNNINCRRIIPLGFRFYEDVYLINNGLNKEERLLAEIGLIKNEINPIFHTTYRRMKLIEDILSKFPISLFWPGPEAININIIFK